MEQRDLIKDQIEQLGKVLGKILSDFLGLKAQGKVAQGIEISNENLKSELDLDIEIILSLNGQELSEYLKDKKLTSEHIEKLIDFIAEIGEHTMLTDKNQAIRIFKKILEMYKIVNAISNAYSFERIHKEEKIKNVLQQCISDI